MSLTPQGRQIIVHNRKLGQRHLKSCQKLKKQVSETYY